MDFWCRGIDSLVIWVNNVGNSWCIIGDIIDDWNR